MTPKRMKRIIRAELGKLRREELVDSETYGDLIALYPITRWDYSALGRWFLGFGAIAAAAGILILGNAIFQSTSKTLGVSLAIVIGGCFYGGTWLKKKSLFKSKQAVELVGGLSIIGFTFTLGAIYSTGFGNWPALLLIDVVVLLLLTYLLRNIWMLVLTLVVSFAWFGGVTGYVSGWKMYWFGMNYPMRFLMAGLLMVGVSLLHRNAERDRLRAYDGFFKVWMSGALFFCEMSLWLMSLFGNYGRIGKHSLQQPGELFLFNAIWFGFNVALGILGNRYGLRMLRGYAMTFFVIQGYTFYFWHIAGELNPILALFLAGGVMLAIVVRLESRRRASKVDPTAATEPPADD